jgi:hypothetical protein
MPSSADVKIQSMTCKGIKDENGHVTVKTSITVHNNNNSNARHVQIIVVLPATSQVVKSEIIATQGVYSGAVVGPSYPQPDVPWPVNGYVIFAHPETMDTIGPKSTVEMSLETKMLNDFVKPITAFVFSSLPDADPSNNCRTTPITVVTQH